jgi:phosphatidylglycerol:prolipoprotein diacylglycerol transferase
VVAAATLLCLWIGPRWIQALEGLDARRCRLALVVIGLIVFAGARLHFALNHSALFVERPWLLVTLGPGGFHAAGAIGALVLGAPLVLRAFRLPVARVLDGLTPTVGVGIAVARIGCLLRGCCFGGVCDAPWCIAYPAGSTVHALHHAHGVIGSDAASSATVHPLPIYFAAAGLLITAVALAMYGRRRYHGQVALVGLWLFSLSAAALEFLRADYAPRAYWGPLPQLEWTALGLMTAATLALVWPARRHSVPPAAPAEV